MVSSKFEKFLRLFEQSLLLKPDFFLYFPKHVGRLLILILRCLICSLQVILLVLLRLQAFLSGLVLLLSHIKTLHFFAEHLIHVCNVDSLIRELCCECRKLVAENGDFSLEVVALLLKFGEAFPDLGQLALFTCNVGLELFVIFSLSIKLLLVVFKVRLLFVEEVLGRAVLFSGFVY